MRKFTFEKSRLRALNSRYIKCYPSPYKVRCTQVDVIEIKPSVRLVKLVKYRDQDQRDIITNYYLSFPYVQFYLRHDYHDYLDVDSVFYANNISFTTEPVRESTRVSFVPLPNVTKDHVFGYHGLCVGRAIANVEEMVNAFWNTIFNKYYFDFNVYPSPFRKWDLGFSLNNWAKLTEKYGAFALEANWTKSFTFDEMTTGRKPRHA